LPGARTPAGLEGYAQAVRTKLGVLLWNQATSWDAYEAAAKRVDELGYDSLYAWDHLYAIFGNPYQPIFEGYATLSAWSKVTTRVRLGLLVGANTFRNPGLVAKMVATLDHQSGGRAICGIGGAWMELEHTANGIDFGSGFGQRLDWLEESVDALETLFAGGSVTSQPGAHYAFKDLAILPPPVQARLPILIGGGGEKKTLRTVARHADMWNVMGPVDALAHKLDVLRAHCDDVGRNIAAIELTAGCKPLIRSTAEAARREWVAQMEHNQTPLAEVEDDDTFWYGTPDRIAELMSERKALGFHTFLGEVPAPFDDETLDRWINEVRPMVDGA
jgi:alkanesulfonate monooxygenase SsuD/methylene tetrahydromethanopterin reductase-like flavin-dependent oxidoreductase (luciferase family)